TDWPDLSHGTRKPNCLSLLIVGRDRLVLSTRMPASLRLRMFLPFCMFDGEASAPRVSTRFRVKSLSACQVAWGVCWLDPSSHYSTVMIKSQCSLCLTTEVIICKISH